MSSLDLRTFSTELSDLAERSNALATPVATCGDWTLADLVWHLAEVQSFWAWIIEQRPAGPETAPTIIRPDESKLAETLRRATDRLCSALDGAEPGEPAWSWSDDRTVGFTLRRQTHEALIHSIDGQLALGRPLPQVAPSLAADGIDELLSVMLSGIPPWATFERRPGVMEIRNDDTADRWLLGFGRMIGTSPDSGIAHDLPALELLDPGSEEPGATITGPALEIDLWLWGRGEPSTSTISGDDTLLAELRAMVVDATQ